MLIFLLSVVTLSILSSVTTSYGEKTLGEPTLSVTAVIAPYTNSHLSTESISFRVTGVPRVYQADQSVVVTISSNYGGWELKCYATPLEGKMGKIPPEQTFVKGPLTKSKGEGELADFVNLSGEVVVDRGSQPPQGKKVTLEFKLKTTLQDQPGTYIGKIHFTYLVIP